MISCSSDTSPQVLLYTLICLLLLLNIFCFDTLQAAYTEHMKQTMWQMLTVMKAVMKGGPNKLLECVTIFYLFLGWAVYKTD